MRLKDLQLRRSLVLMAYEAGRITKETAQAKCKVLTRAIETMAEMNLRRYQGEAREGKT